MGYASELRDFNSCALFAHQPEGIVACYGYQPSFDTALLPSPVAAFRLIRSGRFRTLSDCTGAPFGSHSGYLRAV
eukprot:3016428-Alexandrium_andersonii.AAC.1